MTEVIEGLAEIVETLDIQKIQELIPHRYPFLLIDRVYIHVPGESATGIKNVTINEEFFQGHFPGQPVMPGVLIIEAMAQTACVLALASLGEEAHGKLVYFMTISEAKFRKIVAPGDTLHLKVQKDKAKGRMWRFTGEVYVGDTKVTEAAFSAMLADR